jgi:hypothetical protein
MNADQPTAGLRTRARDDKFTRAAVVTRAVLRQLTGQPPAAAPGTAAGDNTIRARLVQLARRKPDSWAVACSEVTAARPAPGLPLEEHRVAEDHSRADAGRGQGPDTADPRGGAARRHDDGGADPQRGRAASGPPPAAPDDTGILNVPAAQDTGEGPNAVDRATPAPRPSNGDKALAGKITRAVRKIMSNPQLSVRTTALGGGRFRVRLPSTAAPYAGLDSTTRTLRLERLEEAAGARITVTNITASRTGSVFSVVHLRAEAIAAESTGNQPRGEANQGPAMPLPAGSRERSS